MKIKDIVYLVTDSEIVKTKIIGKKEELVKDYDKKETTEVTYLVTTRDSGRNNADQNWAGEENLYPTLEKAQEVIKDRITKEIIEQLSKITVSDVTGGGDVQ